MNLCSVWSRSSMDWTDQSFLCKPIVRSNKGHSIEILSHNHHQCIIIIIIIIIIVITYDLEQWWSQSGSQNQSQLFAQTLIGGSAHFHQHHRHHQLHHHHRHHKRHDSNDSHMMIIYDNDDDYFHQNYNEENPDWDQKWLLGWSFRGWAGGTWGPCLSAGRDGDGDHIGSDGGDRWLCW